MNIARLAVGKGHDMLISIMQKVVQQWPNAVYVIAGDGPNRPDLEKNIQATKLTAHFRLLGHRVDVPQLLALADLFVFPSLAEGFGLSIIEAMASETAVVAFDLRAYHEFVVPEKSAILVKRDAKDQLEEATLRLLVDADRHRCLAECGRQIASSRFSIALSVGKL